MQTETTARQRNNQYRNLLALMANSGPERGSNKSALQQTISMRSIMNCHRLAEAYKEDTRVAYISEQFPSEIVFASGALPWNIESMAIMLAQSIDVNRIFQLTQEYELSRDICSFLRGPHGMMLADCYPTPDVVLTNDQPCEGLAKMMTLAAKHYRAPVLSLNTPEFIDGDSIDYLAAQIERVMRQMDELWQWKRDPEALRSAVRLSNEAREYYCKTAQLFERRALPGVSREMQEIFGMNYFGSRQNVLVCKALYEEALKLADGNEPAGAKRVLWIGQVPEESHELLEHMRRVVDIVYWAPLWASNLRFLDEDKPLHSMAERAMFYHWSAERMRADTAAICEKYNIEGLLIVNVWGCRNVAGISATLRDLATAMKLRHLTINIDLVDRNNYSFSHVKNRVDAFLELLQ